MTYLLRTQTALLLQDKELLSTQHLNYCGISGFKVVRLVQLVEYCYLYLAPKHCIMKYLTLLALLFFSTLSFADAWDNLTEDEAAEMVNYLNANPYIFEYCDCCQTDAEDDRYSMELVEVSNLRVVTCSWDKDYYSVEYNRQPIATLLYKEDGSGMQVTPPPTPDSEEDSPPVIYMNYTWGLNPDSNLAEPLFETIYYHYVAEYGGRSCKEAFPYPKPSDLSKVGEFKGYKQWYKKAAVSRGQTR
jgi:hypothetical protein